MGDGTYNQKVISTVALYEVVIPYYGTYNKKVISTVTFIAIAVPHYTLMRYSRSIIVTTITKSRKVSLVPKLTLDEGICHATSHLLFVPCPFEFSILLAGIKRVLLLR